MLQLLMSLIGTSYSIVVYSNEKMVRQISFIWSNLRQTSGMLDLFNFFVRQLY